MSETGGRAASTPTHAGAAPVRERSLVLSVLDFPMRIEDTIHLALRVEELGYKRFWVAEHAPQPNPMLIVSLVAAATTTIRVGTAGILFHSYSPARAAYDFQLLEHLFAPRIDAGFCGGWFPEPLVDDYLDGRPRSCKSDAAGYERRARTLVRTLRGGGPGAGTQSGEGTAAAWPYAPATCPQIWCVGTGTRSAELAAHNGISFAYSLFHKSSRATSQHMNEYRRGFSAQRPGERAECVLAAAVACGRDDAHARSIAERSNLTAVIPTVVGPARRCMDELRLLGECYSTREIVLLNLADSAEERACSFAELAREGES